MQITARLSKACKIIFALFLVYFTLRLLLYHFYLVIFPYSTMLRDGALMTSTDALVKGLNPYDMALQPQYTNVYGIFYPLLAWPWVKIFAHSLIIHKMVTAVSILACCIFVFFVLKKMRVPFLVNFWALLILYASLLYPGTSTPCVDPAATGLFFLLATIFVPWFCNYSYKSLAISVACGILAFYTKQYTMLGIFMMIPYLFLFVSKNKGLFYSFLWLCLMSISVVVMNRIFPAYFDDCFFNSANMDPAWSTMERLHMQIVLYSGIHQWILILTGLFIVGYAFQFINRKLPGYTKTITLKKVLSTINLKDFKEPLIKTHFPVVLFAGMCSSFVLYKSLGRHNGATLWYFFQLLSPFFLIGTAWLFSRHTLWPVLCVPFLILNLFTITADEDYRYFNKNLEGWPELSLLVSAHQVILNSPLIAPMLIEQNKEVFDNGMAEYFLPGGQRKPWMKILSQEDPRVLDQLILFFENIKIMIENKRFDLILLQPSLLPMGVADDIQKYYKYEGQLSVYAPQDRRPYAVTVWRPL